MSRRDRRSARRQQQIAAAPARDATSRLRPVGVAVLCVKLALVPLAFDHSADVPFVLPKALLSHGLTYVLVAFVAGLLILNGRAFVVRSWLHVPVLAYLGVSVLATAFSVNPTLALFGTHVRMLGLSEIVDGVVTYFAAVHLVRSRQAVVAVVAAMLAASAFVVVYEVIQKLGKDPLRWTIDGSQRPFSTIGQPTTLGEYLAILSVVAFALGALTPALSRRIRGSLVASSVVLLAAAILTGTRSVAVGATAAAAVFVVLVWSKHPDRSARWLSVASAAGAALLFGGLLAFTPLGARVLGTVQFTPTGASDGTIAQLEESAAARLVIYDIAQQIVRERPLLGYGPDAFVAGVPTYRPPAAPVEMRQSLATSAHSWIAYVATSTGLLGLLAFAAVIVVAAFLVLRSSFDPVLSAGAVAVAAYLGAGLTTVSALETDTLLWLGLAAIAGGSAAVERVTIARVATAKAGSRARAGASSRQWIAWALVTAAVLLMLTTLPALAASRSAKQSFSARTPATVATAIDLASRATRSDPDRAEYWQQLALAYVVASRWPDASAAFQRGATLAPYDIRHITDDITTQLTLADGGDAVAKARAVQLADQAVRVDPHNPAAHLSRAVVFARTDIQEAARSVERALSLDPGSTNGQLYVAATQIYVAAGRPDDAIRAGLDGVAVFGPTKSSVPVRVELARAFAAGGRPRDAIGQLNTALTLTPGDQSIVRLLATIPGAADANNAAAQVSASPSDAARGSAITVTWSGLERPSIGDWVGLFPVANPDASYVAWHLTTAEPSGSMTLTIPSSVAAGPFNVRLFLNYSNISVATSDTMSVR